MKAETEAWLASAESDAAAARLLLTNGFYGQSVFFTHLSVEKTLKALILERLGVGVPPRTHNLSRLIESMVESPPEWLATFLDKLSPESAQARYALPPDNAVYTSDLATTLFNDAEEATQWLRQNLT